MARVRKAEKIRAKSKDLTVSHRERLIAELRADPKLATEYLNAAAEDEDPRVYLAALRTVAEAEGMAKVAKAAGVPRESLYRALSAGGNPRFSTFHAILKAAGLKLAVARSGPRR
jgi:probable addiction module antidote protein